jgi:hypothetical protein
MNYPTMNNILVEITDTGGNRHLINPAFVGHVTDASRPNNPPLCFITLFSFDGPNEHKEICAGMSFDDLKALLSKEA